MELVCDVRVVFWAVLRTQLVSVVQLLPLLFRPERIVCRTMVNMQVIEDHSQGETVAHTATVSTES